MEKKTQFEELLATIIVLRDLYKEGYFYNSLLDEPNVPDYTFNKILKTLETNGNPFTNSRKAQINIQVNIVRPQRSEAGLNLCVKCGTLYQVTPQSDAYTLPDGSKSGKVCKSCLQY